jgi:UDP-GlcNAc:undecaprenyl-phosphate/decaprenyl-phosphate GlcNAc-1-phosphate transferase
MAIIALNEWQAVLFAFAASVITVLYFLPKVIKVANRRNITDNPGNHKIHCNSTPTMGGIAIFGGFTCGFLLSVNGFFEGRSYFMAAVLILFFIGLKDDLIEVAPYKKIVALVITGLILCVFTDLRFTNFHGFLGISVIPIWASFAVTIFLIVIIVNAYNLIDGIDGLSSSIGIIASITFGTWSWLSHDTGFTVMSAALTGALIVFMKYNLSSGNNKIFMGDTGSLVTGFIITVMAIRFNELNAGPGPVHKLYSSPAVSIAILIVPLFDSLRVIIIRLIRHQSPLKADNRHIHHLLLRAGFSHKKATLFISLANIFIILIGFLLDHIGILWLGLVLLILCTMLTVPVYILVSKKENWDWKNYRWLSLMTSEQRDVFRQIDAPRIMNNHLAAIPDNEDGKESIAG